MDNSIIDKLREYETVTRMINVLDANGRIVSFTAATPPDVFPTITASVETMDLDYPPQMTASLSQLLNTKRQALADELADLGVTGLGPASPPPAQTTKARQQRRGA